MAQIKSKNTKPELSVRRLLHGLGYRYRLHRSDLPGRPDLVFPSRRKVVFVNGCFWHGHEECSIAHLPASNKEYWKAKLKRNKERDQRNLALLKDDSWVALEVWECELSDLEAVARKLEAFLK